MVGRSGRGEVRPSSAGCVHHGARYCCQCRSRDARPGVGLFRGSIAAARRRSPSRGTKTTRQEPYDGPRGQGAVAGGRSVGGTRSAHRAVRARLLSRQPRRRRAQVSTEQGSELGLWKGQVDCTSREAPEPQCSAPPAGVESGERRGGRGLSHLPIDHGQSTLLCGGRHAVDQGEAGVACTSPRRGDGRSASSPSSGKSCLIARLDLRFDPAPLMP